MEPFQSYPAELRRKEAEAVHQRRSVLSGDAPNPDTELPPDTVGLALSGGGIRSATFNLGVLQALAKRRLLRQVDILSTISGGGYIGSFLGRFYDRLRNYTVCPADLVEGAISDPQSPEVQWLRRHGNYIAPSGKSDLHINLAVFLRNFLTVHFVAGILIFAVFGLANGVRYGLLDRVTGLLPLAGWNWMDMPIGHLVQKAGLHVLWSPWFLLFEAIVLAMVLPTALGYWLTSQDEPETFNGPALTACFLVIGGLLFLGVRNGIHSPALLGAVPFIAALPAVEYAWFKVRRQNAAVGTGGRSVQRLRARNNLTRDLALNLGLAGVLLGFALLDTVGHAIYEGYVQRNASYLTMFAQLGTALAALLPVLQGLVKWIANYQSKGNNPNSMTRLLSQPAVSFLLSLMLITPPLLLTSVLAHGAFHGGSTVGIGLAVTAAAVVFSIIFAHPHAISFINRSSLNQTYAARIARAYLGASNPLRFSSRQRSGRDVDEVMPEDDTRSLQDYRPHESGGPFHILGTCVNETVDQMTQREMKDRQGTIVAVSSLGLSIGRFWHALWEPAGGVQPIGNVPGTPHPLLDAQGRPPCKVDNLQLREWVSISGAAFGPGMGQLTNRSLSILFTLGNLRTGYWWNSGLSAAHRGMRPNISFVRRLLWLLPRLFQTQSCLLDEALARFSGPWVRYWYLSDGGHFENLGVYELIRRRVPFIIAVDAGADPDYDFDDLANLQRKARIDFQAELELFTDADWYAAAQTHLARVSKADDDDEAARSRRKAWEDYLAPIRAQLVEPLPRGGGLDELKPTQDANKKFVAGAKKCAALFKVNHRDGTHQVLLYLKATLTGDEPADLHNYKIENGDFPHQSTSDQFFDEAQWESYRRLGEHLAGKVFQAPGSSAALANGLWLTLLQ